MSDISRHDTVKISDKTQLSFHQLQDIYNSLTGKFEKISEPLTKAYMIRIEDIQQLNIRINQCCESYGAIIKNASITVYHVSGPKEVFSSFDRFNIYNKSNKSPVENVSIEWNILIIPAGTDRAVPYRITANLLSRAGIRSKSPDIFIGPLKFSRIFGRPDGIVTIEYSDYAAARHFLTQITEWYEALDFNPERKWLVKLQRISHWLRDIVPASLSITSIIGLGGVLSSRIADANYSEVVLYLSYILAAAIFAWLAGKIIGRSIEFCIDRIQPVSCIVLNRGDEIALKKWRSSNTFNSIYATAGLIATISINVASSWIFNNLL